jgi:hypothetical protein
MKILSRESLSALVVEKIKIFKGSRFPGATMSRGTELQDETTALIVAKINIRLSAPRCTGHSQPML